MLHQAARSRPSASPAGNRPAAERAARSRHSGGHRADQPGPNSGKTLISPQGTSQGGRGDQGLGPECGAAPPRRPGTRPPSRSRWRATPARAGPGRCGAHPWGAGRPRVPGGCPGATQAPTPPARSCDTVDPSGPAPPPPHTPHRDPCPEALRGGRSPEGGGGAARETGSGVPTPRTRAPWGRGAACPAEGAAGPRAWPFQGGRAAPGKWGGDPANRGGPAEGHVLGAEGGRGAREAPAGSRGAGPSWGRRANVGEGGRARDGFPGSGSARSAAEAGEGAAKRSSDSPRGGRRRRRSRSPCSGWGAAAAVGVPRPECGSGPTGRSGPGGSGTAQGEGGPGRGGVARAGGDGGVGMSRRRLADPELECPQRTEWRMQLPRPALWRGGRGTVGGGGGDSEREPDRLPDLTPSSARVSGGRAGASRGSSGNVVRVDWTSSCGGVARSARCLLGVVVPSVAPRRLETISELQLPRGSAAAHECGGGADRIPELQSGGGAGAPTAQLVGEGRQPAGSAGRGRAAAWVSEGGGPGSAFSRGASASAFVGRGCPGCWSRMGAGH